MKEKSICLTNPRNTGPPEPPGKPSILVSDNCLRLSWPLPAYDGGSRVIGYKIDMKTDLSEWMTITDECNCNSYSINKTRMHFQHNNSYLFRVSAINRHGISEPSLPSDMVSPLENRFVQNMSQSDGN